MVQKNDDKKVQSGRLQIIQICQKLKAYNKKLQGLVEFE